MTIDDNDDDVDDKYGPVVYIAIATDTIQCRELVSYNKLEKEMGKMTMKEIGSIGSVKIFIDSRLPDGCFELRANPIGPALARAVNITVDTVKMAGDKPFQVITDLDGHLAAGVGDVLPKGKIQIVERVPDCTSWTNRFNLCLEEVDNSRFREPGFNKVLAGLQIIDL